MLYVTLVDSLMCSALHSPDRQAFKTSQTRDAMTHFLNFLSPLRENRLKFGWKPETLTIPESFYEMTVAFRLAFTLVSC